MSAARDNLLRRLSQDLPERGFRVSPPSLFLPASTWGADLDVVAGDEWVGLFVAEDPAQASDPGWLESRRYKPGEPRRQAALLTLIAAPRARLEMPVFDFSDEYAATLDELVQWLTQVARGNGTPAAPADRPASAPAHRYGAPERMDALARFDFSPQVALIVKYARALAAMYGGRADTLYAEHLFFGATERGREPTSAFPGVLWEVVREHARGPYEEALRLHFAHWDGKLVDRRLHDVTYVSRNTLDVLEGAAEIARRTSGTDSIAVKDLLAALFVIRPSEPGAQTAAEFVTGMGIPDVSTQILPRLRPLDSAEAAEEWDRIVARTWTVGELVAAPFATGPGLRVRTSSLSDQPVGKDELGFAPYVNAVADFLTNPQTRPPLTLSIEGEWGSGKSSFMRQLEAAIRDRTKDRAITVWFNPWRHDREEALWAAFALEFVRKITRQLPRGRRWSGHLKLLRTRFAWRDGGWDAVRFLLLVVVAVAVSAILLIAVFDDPGLVPGEASGGAGGILLKIGGVGGVLALLVSVLKEVRSFVGNPLQVELRRYVRSPDYDARISFIEQFHSDFGKIVDAYARGEKVYVFIDDLDRCQVPRAADLMQALNLMIAEEQPIVFIIGMDREKIAASLAVKFKDIIPYVGSELPGDALANTEAARALEYGSEFIEKFVQLSLRVPQPREDDVARLLQSLSGGVVRRRSQGPVEQTGAPAATPDVSPVRGGDDGRPAALPREPGAPETQAPAVAAPELARQAMKRSVAVDSQRLHDITYLVAPALDYNPRRLKQFINVCRLNAYIAIETGLITDGEEADPDRLTFEKLGKLVAISLRWPLLLAHLEEDPGLMERLQQLALIGKPSMTGVEAFWSRRTRLMSLLRAGLHGDDGQTSPAATAAYRLTAPAVTQWLRVAAPPAPRPLPASSPAKAAEPAVPA